MATAPDPSIAFIYRDGLDPWAYDVLLAINEVESDFEMQLVYPSTFMSAESAKRVGRKLKVVMHVMVEEIGRDNGSSTMGDVISMVESAMTEGK